MRAPYLTVDEAIGIARKGAEAGCTEALFTLGDQPERRYRAAREALAEMGFESTIDYLVHAARRVHEETGLLPHVNPGVMQRDELARLREVSVSAGIMLESTSRRLCEKGGPHYGSPDKDPAVRLATLERAGALAVPFTTGILIGIGETRRERVESLLAIRDLADRHGHVQEVIVQNFRAKPGTPMAAAPEPALEDHLWTIAAARLLLGPDTSVQAPPNLRPGALPRLVEAGIDDWGGVSPVTPDHVNPEAPWPHLIELERATGSAGKSLAPRLPLYPRYVADLERWVDPGLRSAVLAASDGQGLGRDSRWYAGDAVQAPERPGVGDDRGFGCGPEQGLHAGNGNGGHMPAGVAALERHTVPGSGEIAEEGAAARVRRRLERHTVPGPGEAVLVTIDGRESGHGPGGRSAADGDGSPSADFVSTVVTSRTTSSLDHVFGQVSGGAALDEAQIVRLFEARGGEARAVCEAADALRRERNGDVVTYVVNRNVNYTNVCYFKCRFCAFSKGRLSANLRGRPYDLDLAEIARRTREAWERGATEVCLQGGIHPDYTGETYLSICRAVKEAAPGVHVHAFSPLEVWQGARTLGIELGGIPREAARGGARLPARHRGRDPRRRGAPGDLPGQDHHRRMAGGDGVRASRRSGLDRHHHVRPRGRLPALGAAPAAGARPGRAHRRVHRVRAPALRAHGVADVPARPRPARADAARGGADARRRPARPRPLDRERPDLVGEDGAGRDAARARGRRQRRRRDPDERIHHPRGGGRIRAGDAPGAARSRHPRSRAVAPATHHPLHRSARFAPYRLVRCARAVGAGVPPRETVRARFIRATGEVRGRVSRACRLANLLVDDGGSWAGVAVAIERRPASSGLWSSGLMLGLPLT